MANDGTFRSWVPEWLIRLTIILVMLPTVMLFALSTANVNAATGFYGVEPADIQFSMVVYYSALAAFTPLERRFFSRISTKEYFLICLVLQVIVTFCIYNTRQLPVLYICRFLQGIFNCGVTSICLTLLFSRLKSNHAREIGYAFFYALILCASSFTSLITAPIIDDYEYNVLYKVMIYCFFPGAILLLLMMNRIHLVRRVPLYQLDWGSFFLYAPFLVCLAYVLIYGQQYYWLQDATIVWSLVAVLGLGLVFVVRQLTRKRPLIHMEVFRYKGFVFGITLVGLLYIIRGAFNVTTTYFSTVLGMDPLHIYELFIYNILGVATGTVISARLIIKQRPTQFIWLVGFFLMLLFHGWMYFLFASEADQSTFIVPLFIQGAGAGLLMTPIILFTISSVPFELSQSAAAVGVFIRFAFFSGSTALINFFSIYFSNIHSARLSDHVTAVDDGLQGRLHTYQSALQGRGLPMDQAAKAATGLLNRAMQKQVFLKYAMDYYALIAILIAVIMLIIVMAPFINRTIINVRAKQPAAATF
ncbi:MFS transporter [Chitinophaga sp. Cy-1792]|uniref:MFS transporter n=1 Tax=Chitinophaga sp. Cy-1792 TaxID=2608339 RepID=UPI0014200C25|nr:MFS transporter [Chitinophaga sp. Cy-1792]NIG56178.1 MFS transporter [Chitinophaga sp. Cy-1792]